MKKRNLLILCVVVMMAGVGFYLYKQKKSESYPQIVYIDDISYYNTNTICDMVPRTMPDGTIETFVSPEIMPDSYNSANFGSEYGSLEYMFLEDGKLIVHVGEDWYYFE